MPPPNSQAYFGWFSWMSCRVTHIVTAMVWQAGVHWGQLACRCMAAWWREGQQITGGIKKKGAYEFNGLVSFTNVWEVAQCNSVSQLERHPLYIRWTVLRWNVLPHHIYRKRSYTQPPPLTSFIHLTPFKFSWFCVHAAFSTMVIITK